MKWRSSKYSKRKTQYDSPLKHVVWIIHHSSFIYRKKTCHCGEVRACLQKNTILRILGLLSCYENFRWFKMEQTPFLPFIPVEGLFFLDLFQKCLWRNKLFQFISFHSIPFHYITFGLSQTSINDVRWSFVWMCVCVSVCRNTDMHSSPCLHRILQPLYFVIYSFYD